MKAPVLDLNGKKTKEINLPSCFNEKIRTDIIKKAFEAEISDRMPYGSFGRAGKQHSAAGKLYHARRKWKTTYGFGISRVPRKIFWRRGTRFMWEGAFAAGTRGGKRAHPPKAEKIWLKKINKKERTTAVRGAIAATANEKAVFDRYKNLIEISKVKLPIIVESKLNEIKKTKELKETLKKILGQISEQLVKIAFREKKKVRAGKGKGRGRKYKKSKGIIIITATNIKAGESLKGKGVDIIGIDKINLKQLAPAGIPGRLTIYTEDAIKQMEKITRLK